MASWESDTLCPEGYHDCRNPICRTRQRIHLDVSPREREDEQARFRRDFESDDYPEPDDRKELDEA